MEDIIATLREFNSISVIVRLLLALACGGMIGSERGRRGHPAGFRTYILVCLGSAMTVMVGLYTTQVLGYDSDPLRVGAQVVSGIGFLGAGTILIRGGSKITGLTTAAALWATATIGLAAGAGFYFGAILCAIIAMLTTAVLSRLEKNLKNNRATDRVYVEMDDPRSVNLLIEKVEQMYELKAINVIAPKSCLPNHLGLELVFYHSIKDQSRQIRRQLLEMSHVVYAVDSDS